MAIEFRLPDPGEGIHEAEIIQVLVSPGDKVEDGQSVLEIETDKAATEVPSPVTGTVKEIPVHSGDVVNVGDVIMVFEEEAAGPEAGEPAKRRKAEPEERKMEPPRKKEEGPPREEVSERRRGPVPAAPSTRRVARELGVDLREVEPTGPGGRVLTEDVRAYGQASKPPEKKEERKEKPEEKPAAAGEERALPDFQRWGPIERIPLRSIRRATARRMAQSWAEIPHVTHQDVADITELEAFRLKHKAAIEKQGGSLTLTMFVLKAVVAALKAYPRFNASLDMEKEEIIVKQYYDIGVAVDTDRGLLVPVLRHVDCKSIAELAVELRALAERTRKGEASRDDLTGSTFTVTNVGPMGGTGFAPIINYPEVAILGLARARLQPVVVGDISQYKIVPRLILPLALGFDHRVVDGADAARFVKTVVDALENPEDLMMKV